MCIEVRYIGTILAHPIHIPYKHREKWKLREITLHYILNEIREEYRMHAQRSPIQRQKSYIIPSLVSLLAHFHTNKNLRKLKLKKKNVHILQWAISNTVRYWPKILRFIAGLLWVCVLLNGSICVFVLYGRMHVARVCVLYLREYPVCIFAWYSNLYSMAMSSVYYISIRFMDVFSSK